MTGSAVVQWEMSKKQFPTSEAVRTTWRRFPVQRNLKLLETVLSCAYFSG